MFLFFPFDLQNQFKIYEEEYDVKKKGFLSFFDEEKEKGSEYSQGQRKIKWGKDPEFFPENSCHKGSRKGAKTDDHLESSKATCSKSQGRELADKCPLNRV
jgi:hypothetical protein